MTVPRAQAEMTRLFRALRAEELQTSGTGATRIEGYHITLRPGDKGFDFIRERLARPLALAAVAGLSCYLPARRAANVDPIVALGSE